MSSSESLNFNPGKVMKAQSTKETGANGFELDRRDKPSRTAASCGSTPSHFRLKRILVPIDFSDCAKKALQYAIPLAQEHEAALTLLYVVPAHYAVGEYGGFNYASLEAEMRASGDKQLAVLTKDEVRGEVPVETVVCSGSPAAEIIQVAATLPADLIVISTHGRTGLRHVFVGSVTEYVVRHAPCPVLVVRQHEHEFLAA
jgi:nucleotide-binding universal stress UspA family protein